MSSGVAVPAQETRTVATSRRSLLEIAAEGSPRPAAIAAALATDSSPHDTASATVDNHNEPPPCTASRALPAAVSARASEAVAPVSFWINFSAEDSPRTRREPLLAESTI